MIDKGRVSCALKNPENWNSHKVVLGLADDAGKAYNCTKVKDAVVTATTCAAVTLSELTDINQMNLTISASFNGSGNKVYTCYVAVDDVEDKKMIYAEKIVTSAYITHSDSRIYRHMHSSNIQYATKGITTAHCGVYNNNANPTPIVAIILGNSQEKPAASSMFVDKKHTGALPSGLTTIKCRHTFSTVTIESTLKVFLVEQCPSGAITNSTGGCDRCVDGYRSSDQSQFEPCLQCVAGKGPNDDRTSCINCEQGKYSASGKKCEICPHGTAANKANTTCDPCPIGYAGTGGACSPCQSVNATTSTDVHSNHAKTEAVYHYAAIQGQTSCTNCTQEVECGLDATNKMTCTGCKVCAISETVVKGTCFFKPCQSGSTKNLLSGRCVPCMPGTYDDNGTCVNCTAGLYQDKAEQTSCKPCHDPDESEAMYQPQPGKSYCYPIKPGYSLDNENASLLTKMCKAGTFSPGGDATCKECDADNKEYSSEDGSAFCSKCTIGKVIDGGTNCGGVYCEGAKYISKQVTAENTTYFFEKTSANSQNNKQVRCNTSDNVEYITRYCLYNEEKSIGEWLDPDFGQCSSANSAKLNAILTMNLENTTAVEENTKEMEKMAGNVSALLPSDISLIASSLSKIGNLSADKISPALVASVTSTIGSLADSGDKLKSVAPEKKADLVATLEAMAMASNSTEGIQQNSVAIKRIDTTNVSLPMPKNMNEDEKPSLDLGDIDKDQNASVAIFDASAKDLFPEPKAEIDPTGMEPVKKKEVGSCIVALTMVVEHGHTFTLSLSSKNKGGISDAEAHGAKMLVERHCHYLDTEDKTWKTDGCNTSTNKVTGFIECTCNHTTSFAILLSISEIKDTFQDDFSTAMQAINVIFLVLTFVCLAPFKKFRSRRLMQIQIQLVISLILANVGFMILSSISKVMVNENKRPLISLNVGCTVGIIIVEYLFLAVMAWMTCAAVTLYGKIVDALKTYGKIDRFYFFKCMVGCWGIPIVLPLASFITSYAINDMEYNATTNDIYQTPFIMSSGKNGTACWVATPWKQISFFLPCWTCLILNIVLLCMISRVIIRSARTGSASAGHAREVKALMTIGITVGVPWIFAALTFGAIAQTFQWLFILLANLQGPIMFICFVIFQEDVLNNLFGMVGKTPPKILTTSSKARSAREISSMAKATSVTQVERDEKAVVGKEDNEEAEYAAPDENVYSNKEEAPKPDPDKVLVQPAASAAEPAEVPEYSDPVLEATSFPYRDTESDSQLDMPPPPPGNEEEIYENKTVGGEAEEVNFVQNSYPHIPQLV